MKIDDAIMFFEKAAEASARLGTEKLELGAIAHIAYGTYSQIAEWLKELKQRRTIDAVSEVHGTWEEKETFCIDDDPLIERWQSARCSMCERYHTTPYMYYFNDYNYCPYCGADMRGEDDGR